jgi:sarcosine oxidase, subunit gamma
VTADLRRGALGAAESAALEAASGDRIRVVEVPNMSILNVRARVEAAGAFAVDLPARPGTVTRAGEVAALGLGPDEWLVVGPAPATEAPDGCGVVEVSAQYTTFELSGSAARDVLAHGCALDLERLGADGCAQTTLARAAVTIWATAPDRYRLIVRRSFARYLAAWLLDASIEYR